MPARSIQLATAPPPCPLAPTRAEARRAGAARRRSKPGAGGSVALTRHFPSPVSSMVLAGVALVHSPGPLVCVRCGAAIGYRAGSNQRWCGERFRGSGTGSSARGGFDEAAGEVEVLDVVGDGVDQDGLHADDVGRLEHAEHGIAEKGSTESLTLVTMVDGETAEDDDRDRVGHVAAHGAGGGVAGDGPGGEGVVADDGGAGADDVGAGGAGCLVSEGAS